MRLVSKKDAVSLIDKCIKELGVLPAAGQSLERRSDWDSWLRTLEKRIEAVFGTGTSQVAELSGLVAPIYESESTRERSKAAIPVKGLLLSFRREIEDLWEEEPKRRTPSGATAISRKSRGTSPSSGSVFLVHGHDHGRLQSTARFVEQLGLKPVILHERPNQGNTIIEKLEHHSAVAFAIVLLTPDDEGAVKGSDKLNFRARQNVVLELGYFLAKLGRRKTCALLVPGVEIPSDYSGIVYISIDPGDAWKLQLVKEFRAAGFDVDANRAL